MQIYKLGNKVQSNGPRPRNVAQFESTISFFKGAIEGADIYLTGLNNTELFSLLVYIEKHVFFIPIGKTYCCYLKLSFLLICFDFSLGDNISSFSMYILFHLCSFSDFSDVPA